MTDESDLIARLLKIEALHSGAATPGEKQAAEAARQRILERLAQSQKVEVAQEFALTIPDPWERRVFFALARRYGLNPYRYTRQRASSVNLRATTTFFNETFWPEFQAIADELVKYLDSVTTRVIAEAIHKDTSEPAEQPESKKLK